MNRVPILVVEDDAAIREGLREFLESEGYRVLTAENGLMGLEIIRAQGGACFVLLDLQMPVMTGEELIETLKREKDANVRGVRILVLTARAEGFGKDGAIGFLRKPVDLDQLLERISHGVAAGA